MKNYNNSSIAIAEFWRKKYVDLLKKTQGKKVCDFCHTNKELCDVCVDHSFFELEEESHLEWMEILNPHIHLRKTLLGGLELEQECFYICPYCGNVQDKPTKLCQYCAKEVM